MKFDPKDIKIHGNGFAVLILDDKGDVRLHAWDHRIPRQRVDTSIHNHRFTFKSMVLRGAILNTIYKIEPQYSTSWRSPTHDLYTPAPHNDPAGNNTLVPLGVTVTFVANRVYYVHEGNEYVLPAEIFHSSHHFGTSMTLLRKMEVIPEVKVQVACPLGREPDNEFDREKQEIPDWLVDLYEDHFDQAKRMVGL